MARSWRTVLVTRSKIPYMIPPNVVQLVTLLLEEVRYCA